ncbi:MAG TPA: response regulator, partial [Symbiobacteriaceae bacterium]|nr:response regulator [Symbiobacteriaceae bacterium]
MNAATAPAGGLRVLVADDEPPARSELIYLLQREPGIGPICEAEDGLAALQRMAEFRPHAVLLDIQMPGVDGLTLAQTLEAWPGERPQVVFTTAYDEYAIAAFELNAVDYLLKPVQPVRLSRALARLQSRLTAPAPSPPDLEGLLRQMGRQPWL